MKKILLLLVFIAVGNALAQTGECFQERETKTYPSVNFDGQGIRAQELSVLYNTLGDEYIPSTYTNHGSYGELGDKVRVTTTLPSGERRVRYIQITSGMQSDIAFLVDRGSNVTSADANKICKQQNLQLRREYNFARRNAYTTKVKVVVPCSQPSQRKTTHTEKSKNLKVVDFDNMNGQDRRYKGKTTTNSSAKNSHSSYTKTTGVVTSVESTGVTVGASSANNNSSVVTATSGANLVNSCLQMYQQRYPVQFQRYCQLNGIVAGLNTPLWAPGYNFMDAFRDIPRRERLALSECLTGNRRNGKTWIGKNLWVPIVAILGGTTAALLLNSDNSAEDQAGDGSGGWGPTTSDGVGY